MIAKHILSKKPSKSHSARLVRYIVDAEGGIDPRSWRRTADYVLESKTNRFGEKVGGVRVTNCDTDDPAAATVLIEATQAGNKRSKTDKTYHLVFSFEPGERPDIETLHAIEDELVASIGYAEHQRISAVHIDKQHLHVHVAINKVRKIGNNYLNISPGYDHSKLMVACDEIERKYKLKPTNHGLTGERKRDRSIELAPEQRHDRRRKNALSKSYHRAIAERPKAEAYNGLRNLSGCGMAHDAERYSVLLPGNASDSLESERAEYHNGLRWEGGGDSGPRPRLNQGQAKMEAYSGIESLIKGVSRDVAPAMRTAKTWQELHSILAEHGLQIKKRGAGLVIGSGELWAKASQIDRAFSLKNLTDRLGEFEKATHKPKKEYQPKPVQKHPSTAKLYEIYQQEKLHKQVHRDRLLAQLKRDAASLDADVKLLKTAERLIVKASFKGEKKRAGLKTIKAQMTMIQIQNRMGVNKRYRQIIIDTVTPSWSNWLIHQAQHGNTEAIEVLRSRPDNPFSMLNPERTEGNYLTVRNPELTAGIIFNFPGLQVDKDGTISYRTVDGGLVVDRKTSIQALKTTKGSTQLAVEIAAKRYSGQALIVEGQEQFRKDVARLAGAYELQVRFADPELEKDRVAAIPENRKSKTKGKEADR